MLIVSIMFSPLLRRLLSHPSVVYLGSISFPLYLLHGTWIRLFLTWILYQFLPRFSFLHVIEYRPGFDQDIQVFMACPSIICKFVVAVVFCFWLASLLLFCRIWKQYVDVLGVQCSRWAEDVVLGKRGLIENISFSRPQVRGDWLLSGKTLLMRDTEKVQ